jgi:hypothetical protein
MYAPKIASLSRIGMRSGRFLWSTFVATKAAKPGTDDEPANERARTVRLPSGHAVKLHEDDKVQIYDTGTVLVNEVQVWPRSVYGLRGRSGVGMSVALISDGISRGSAALP